VDHDWTIKFDESKIQTCCCMLVTFRKLPTSIQIFLGSSSKTSPLEGNDFFCKSAESPHHLRQLYSEGSEPVIRARRACKAESHGHRHQIGKRVGLHLLHYFPAVCLHSDLTYAEFATYLFVQQTGNN
jgi:hypothetical protein